MAFPSVGSKYFLIDRICVTTQLMLKISAEKARHGINLHTIGISYRLNGSMAISNARRGGRKSKGDRKLVGSRMPVVTATQLEIVAEASGQTVSDYVAELVAAHLSTVDLSILKIQEELPIVRAS